MLPYPVTQQPRGEDQTGAVGHGQRRLVEDELELGVSLSRNRVLSVGSHHMMRAAGGDVLRDDDQRLIVSHVIHSYPEYLYAAHPHLSTGGRK